MNLKSDKYYISLIKVIILFPNNKCILDNQLLVINTFLKKFIILYVIEPVRLQNLKKEQLIINKIILIKLVNKS